MAETEFAFILDVKGNVVKRDKNLSEEADRVVTEITSLLTDGKLDEVFALYYIFERDARNVADLLSYLKATLHLLEMLAQHRLWEKLVETVLVLSKRRGQFTQAIVDIVQKCVTFLDKFEQGCMDIRKTFMKTLIAICENKIYVENERARLLMMLAHEAEQQGNLDEAFKYIRDVQVESFSAMKSEEKNDFMLEQIRYCLLKSDQVRAQIVANRINESSINEKEHPALKYKYYQTLLKINFIQKNFIKVVKLGLDCIKLDIVDSNPTTFYPIYKTVIMCLLVCPLDTTRAELSKRVVAHKNFIEMGFLKAVVEMFMSNELIEWSKIHRVYSEEFKQFLTPENFIYMASIEDAPLFYDLFRTRVNEQNIKVVNHCYSQISLTRLGQLLDLSVDETETVLCHAVYDKVAFARINRPKQIVSFKPVLSDSEILNSYITKITNLFDNISHISVLIKRDDDSRVIIEQK